MATQLGQLYKGCEDETQRPVKAHGHRICRKSAADIEAKEACTVYLQKMDFRKFALHDLDKELDSPPKQRRFGLHNTVGRARIGKD